MLYLIDEFDATGGFCAHGLGLQEYSIKKHFFLCILSVSKEIYSFCSLCHMCTTVVCNSSGWNII